MASPVRADPPCLRADFNWGGGRGACRQELRRALRAHGASSGLERSMASSRGSSRGQPRSQYQDGFNVPDAAFTPSHCALVQVQTALEIMCQDFSI